MYLSFSYPCEHSGACTASAAAWAAKHKATKCEAALILLLAFRDLQLCQEHAYSSGLAVQHGALSTRRHICAMGSHATYKAKRPCSAAPLGAERRRHPVRRWWQHCGGGDARTTVITASLLLSHCTVFYILFFFLSRNKALRNRR